MANRKQRESTHSMKKKAKKTAKVIATPAPIAAVEAAPKWVEDMHDYYREHGYYRAMDLQRLLGDPMGSVEGGAEVFSFNGLPEV